MQGKGYVTKLECRVTIS